MDGETLERWRRAREAFGTLIDLPADARAARLAAIGSGDARLAADLAALLAQVGELVDETDGAEAAAEPVAQRAGTVIGGRFRLLGLLGIGGMGEVHLAERTDELDRKVALKLVRSDLPIPVARARREQQILARLSHPHIAALVDAGIGDAGQPWFAMEYIDGARITDWCDRRALDLPARARLFARVCRAVQFAHRNLILHRDIKPSNILVDAEGEPRLLDFGIAKLLDGTDAQQTQTLAFTPAYAAPEQLRGEPATTAGDVYQLGLVLYELAAGVPARRAHEVARARADDDTPLPRVDQAFGALTVQAPDGADRIARERGLGVERLRRSLRGDLGRIVAKATAADPRERYDTAQALAEDLERWADGRPVAAHRGTFAYRLRKLVRRHRVATAIIALLALGLVASTLFAVHRAAEEREQRRQAEAAGRRADQQRQRAEILLGFMNDMFRQADPQNADGVEPTATQMLERAATALEARTDLDAVTHAALLTQVADTFNSLFLPGRAADSAQRAVNLLEPERERRSGEYLMSVGILLDALQMLDRSDAQLALVEHALPIAARTEEPAIWSSLLLKFRGAARCSRGDFPGCAADLREALQRIEGAPGARPAGVASTLHQLAVLLNDEGYPAEAVRLLRQALDALDRDPAALRADRETMRVNLANSLAAQGRADEAITLIEKGLAEPLGLYGSDAPFVEAMLRRSLARAKVLRGEYAQARELLAAPSGAMPADHPGLPRHFSHSHLVAARIALDLADPAAALAEVEAARRQVATESDAGATLLQLRVEIVHADALLRSGRCDLALPRWQAARERLDASIGATPSWIGAEISDGLGRCALAAGDTARAESAFTAAIAGFASATGEASPWTVRSRIHRLWAQAMASHDAALLDRLDEARGALAEALGGSARAQVWQTDLLIETLSSELRVPLDRSRAERADQARAAFTALTGRPVAFRDGLTGFN
ncbi:serine/threonine-protein kinase [Dokdonella koreensis]|uniref:TPR repeat-containing serine/threonine protein kinase n=1 Tax=Dokdonella koreensis DS-123 TaxID=1300342 RepID=A0A160DY53_9GAMM|nr:serine/threonine-protein kinase [Dokdonella koreensis]ANB18943.1 TPR repeat-containing serine/threonine protein kinase [Dokdonella koreensis DS-123]